MEEYKKKLQDAQDDLRQYEILYENLRYIAGESPKLRKILPKSRKKNAQQSGHITIGTDKKSPEISLQYSNIWGII